MNPILYLLSRLTKNEPLIDDFLFGDYAARPYPGTLYAECEDGSTVAFSKNTSRFPKIIGRNNLVVPTDLMLDLRTRITAKWRKVEFTEPFHFEWDSDGFEIIEQYEEQVRKELEAEGITDSYEQDNHILTDDGLVYLDMIKRYRSENLPDDHSYWELVALNSYRTVESVKPESVLLVSKAEQRVCRVSGEFDRKSVPEGYRPLPTCGLAEHGFLSLNSGTFAIAAEIMPYIQPWIEPEYYSIQPVFEHEIDAC